MVGRYLFQSLGSARVPGPPLVAFSRFGWNFAELSRDLRVFSFPRIQVIGD